MLRRLNACPDLQEVVDQAVENMKTSHTGLKVWHQFARVATEDGIEDEKEQTAQLLHCVRHIVSIPPGEELRIVILLLLCGLFTYKSVWSKTTTQVPLLTLPLQCSYCSTCIPTKLVKINNVVLVRCVQACMSV